MLVDATHSEELRVVVAEDERILEFDVETAGKTQLKGNIYVAEISRVEPSLQAAFITFGGNRNGFLAFGEVHPMWFDIDEKEKKGLLKELADVAQQRQNKRAERDQEREDTKKAAKDAHKEKKAAIKSDDKKEPAEKEESTLSQAEKDEDARALSLANSLEEDGTKKPTKRGRPKKLNKPETKTKPDTKEERKAPIHRRYNIANVLKQGQKILVQVVKEERGSKGAALTTYYTLPGRFTVLMPNTPYAGGISRKIYNHEDRKPLKEIYDGLKIPDEMGLIVRTAGVGQDKDAIKKDFKNLTTLWKKINKDFKATEGIHCVHEDGSVILRAMRDMVPEDIEEILIAGNRTYKQVKDFTKSLMPEMSKMVKEYKKDTPIFIENGVERALARLHNSRVELPSGGYLVIDPTEALVSIDINSGRATQEKSIEDTAIKTNLEAAEVIARQLRLRDLAGLVVIDFIDMEDHRHNRQVERAMRKFVRKDRARIQIAPISNFGLMEISRQRLRPSFGESHFITCPTCNGKGEVHSLATGALMILRRLEETDAQEADKLIVHTASDLIIYILNYKRDLIRDMEARYKYQILFRTDNTHVAPDHKLELIRVKADGSETSKSQEVILREQPELPPEARPRKRRSRKANSHKSKQGSVTKHTKSADKKETKPHSRHADKKKEDSKKEQKPRTRSRAKAAENKAESKKVSSKTTSEKAKKKSPEKKEIKDKPVMVQRIVVEEDAPSKKTTPPKEAASSKFQRWWSK